MFLPLPWNSIEDSSAAQSLSVPSSLLRESSSSGGLRAFFLPFTTVGANCRGDLAGWRIGVDAERSDSTTGSRILFRLQGRGVAAALEGAEAVPNLEEAPDAGGLPAPSMCWHCTVAFITIAFCRGSLREPLETRLRFSNSLRPGSLCTPPLG